MDCHDVAKKINYSADGASKVLADLWSEDLVHRQPAADVADADYEYRLKSNVSVR